MSLPAMRKEKKVDKKKCTLYDYVHVCSLSVCTYIYSIYTVMEWKYNKCLQLNVLPSYSLHYFFETNIVILLHYMYLRALVTSYYD